MPKLSERDLVLLRECAQGSIMDDGGAYHRLGGTGTVPIRYHYRSLPSLQDRGLVECDRSAWRATVAGRRALAESGRGKRDA